ncbi:MAG: L-ribulose-5-phosphate 4-epimerase [Endomicrobium sp.]|jgi:L-ribulose-5-phosphate 4-epimerase|nr:L-ribulose-5-phosphate 4-epimerase [Endomicrobium sp.]
MTLKQCAQKVQDEVTSVRKIVSDLHAKLTKEGLVVWSAGNISQRLKSADLFVIKPSGIAYDELTPESMVVCDLNGNLVDGTHNPSSDTAAHAYVYRNMSDHVYGVVHTHSTYATAWAAAGEEIPCHLTMMADEFGGQIPLGPFAIVGDDSIGRGIVDTLKGSKSVAVLMQNHGPFTIGKDAKSAVKTAVMLEEVAKTTFIAKQIGSLVPIPKEIITKLHNRYQNVYGQ